VGLCVGVCVGVRVDRGGGWVVVSPDDIVDEYDCQRVAGIYIV